MLAPLRYWVHGLDTGELEESVYPIIGYILRIWVLIIVEGGFAEVHDRSRPHPLGYGYIYIYIHIERGHRGAVDGGNLALPEIAKGLGHIEREVDGGNLALPEIGKGLGIKVV